RLCHQVSLLSTFAIGLALTACGSHADSGTAVADDAITGTPQAFQAGDELVTTGNLNLREQPSLSARVLTVMPRGSSVTVASLFAPKSDEEKGALDDTGDAPPDSDDPGAETDDAGACVDDGDACTVGDTCCDPDEVCGDDPDFSGETICTPLFAHRTPRVPGP